MEQISKILNQWQYFIEKSEVSEEMAIARVQKCVKCEFLKTAKTPFFKDGKFGEIDTYVCGKCFCPLAGKVRSLNEKCDLNEW